MAYATDILSGTFNKTKELFFPIHLRYWFKMGFVSLMAGSSSGGSGNSGSSSRSFRDVDFKQAVSEFNSKALDFLSNYGTLVGIIFGAVYLLSLIFAYIGSLFTFVFFDGLNDKQFKIKESIKKTKKQANSLFMFRLVFGLISLAMVALIFWPLIHAFMNNALADFDLWKFIPMIIGLILFAIVAGLVMFIVNDFLIPIMYLKNYGINEAWHHFKGIASKKKMEVFIYWLMKIVLGMAAGMIALLSILVLILPGILFLVLFGGIGVLMFFGIKMISEVLAIGVVIVYAAVILMLMVYLLNVLFVPIPAFFRMYSLEMVNKLENSK